MTIYFPLKAPGMAETRTHRIETTGSLTANLYNIAFQNGKEYSRTDTSAPVTQHTQNRIIVRPLNKVTIPRTNV